MRALKNPTFSQTHSLQFPTKTGNYYSDHWLSQSCKNYKEPQIAPGNKIQPIRFNTIQTLGLKLSDWDYVTRYFQYDTIVYDLCLLSARDTISRDEVRGDSTGNGTINTKLN